MRNIAIAFILAFTCQIEAVIAADPTPDEEKRDDLFVGECEVKSAKFLAHDFRSGEMVSGPVNDQRLGRFDLKFQLVRQWFDTGIVDELEYFEIVFSPGLSEGVKEHKIYTADLYNALTISENFFVLGDSSKNLSLYRTYRDEWHGTTSFIQRQDDVLAHFIYPVVCKIDYEFENAFQLSSRSYEIKAQNPRSSID